MFGPFAFFILVGSCYARPPYYLGLGTMLTKVSCWSFVLFSRYFLLFCSPPPSLASSPRRGGRSAPEKCVFRPAAPPILFAFPAGRAVDRVYNIVLLRLPFERLGCAIVLSFSRPSLFLFGVILHVSLYASGFFRCVGPYGRYSRMIPGMIRI